jgi:hypothetical protein
MTTALRRAPNTSVEKAESSAGNGEIRPRLPWSTERIDDRAQGASPPPIAVGSRSGARWHVRVLRAHSKAIEALTGSACGMRLYIWRRQKACARPHSAGRGRHQVPRIGASVSRSKTALAVRHNGAEDARYWRGHRAVSRTRDLNDAEVRTRRGGAKGESAACSRGHVFEDRSARSVSRRGGRSFRRSLLDR